MDTSTFNTTVLSPAIRGLGATPNGEVWARAKVVVPKTTATAQEAIALLVADGEFHHLVFQQAQAGKAAKKAPKAKAPKAEAPKARGRSKDALCPTCRKWLRADGTHGGDGVCRPRGVAPEPTPLVQSPDIAGMIQTAVAKAVKEALEDLLR